MKKTVVTKIADGIRTLHYCDGNTYDFKQNPPSVDKKVEVSFDIDFIEKTCKINFAELIHYPQDVKFSHITIPLKTLYQLMKEVKNEVAWLQYEKSIQ